MNKSESIKALAAALCKAQGQLEGARKDSANPYFKSKYADLSSVWEACRDALQENELSVVQFPVSGEEGIGVETILLHSSGEWISERFFLPVAKQDAQGGGACLTYARRYALAAVVGVCPEDDDGNTAADASKELRKKALAILEPAARKGLRDYELAFKALSQDMRVAVKNDHPGLKERANAAAACATVS